MSSDAPGAPAALLGSADPQPVIITEAGGSSPFLLIGDHAGNVIPSALGDLGLGEADRSRHIAWDIGVAGVGEALAGRLDATFIRQVYSRLVVDCNRSPGAVDAIAPVSDSSPVPGNQDLNPDARAARVSEIHEPYHQAIAAEIERRRDAGRPVILIALHSFTPALANGLARPWQVGVLYDGGETAFSHAVLSVLRRDPALTVGDNQPYAMNNIDYTVPRHCYPGAIPYAELEVRQDLIGDAQGQAAWAERIAEVLTTAAQAAG